MKNWLIVLTLLFCWNNTDEVLTVYPLCNGYLYGNPEVLYPGETCSWEWQRGCTGISSWGYKSGSKTWGPHPKRVRKNDAGDYLFELRD